MKNALFITLFLALFPFVSNAEVTCPQGQTDNGSGTCIDEEKAIQAILKNMVRPAPTSTAEGFARVREIEAALGKPEAFFGAKSILRAQLSDLQGQLGIYTKVLSEKGMVFFTTEKDGKLKWSWLGMSATYDKKQTDYAKRCTPDGKICAGQYVVSKSGYAYKVSGAFEHGLLLEYDEFLSYKTVTKVSLPTCPEANTWMHSKKFRPNPELMKHYQDPKAGYYTEGGFTYIRGTSRVEACFADGTVVVTEAMPFGALGGFTLQKGIVDPKDYIPYASYNTEKPPAKSETAGAAETYDSAYSAY